jgi:hypothetical protein
VHRKLLPEVVLLLVAGVLTGPNVLGLASRDEAIEQRARARQAVPAGRLGGRAEGADRRGGRRVMVT